MIWEENVLQRVNQYKFVCHFGHFVSGGLAPRWVFDGCVIRYDLVLLFESTPALEGGHPDSGFVQAASDNISLRTHNPYAADVPE